MSLFYIEYGCSISTERAIIHSESLSRAEDYAYQSAQELYYSYDCNYPDADDFDEMDEAAYEDFEEQMIQEMELDIFYLAEEYDEKNEMHRMTMRE